MAHTHSAGTTRCPTCCDVQIIPIGKGGGWYRVCQCPAHPSFDKTARGYRAARSEAAQHEARRLPPEPAKPTVREAVQRWSIEALCELTDE